jgi:hypothetical protein
MNKRRKTYLKVKNIKNNNMPKNLRKILGRLTQKIANESIQHESR